MDALAFIIRAARPDEFAYVVDSWVETFAASATAVSMPKEVYKTRWHALAHRAATLASATCEVVCPAAADGVILAWLLREGTTLHYVQTREDHRRMGHCRRLLARAAVTHYSSRTTDWQIVSRHLPRMTYDPTLLWRWFAPIARDGVDSRARQPARLGGTT